MSAQVSIASDNVYRGVSLTDGRPDRCREFNLDSDAGCSPAARFPKTHLYRQSSEHPEFTVDAGFATR